MSIMRNPFQGNLIYLLMNKNGHGLPASFGRKTRRQIEYIPLTHSAGWSGTENQHKLLWF